MKFKIEMTLDINEAEIIHYAILNGWWDLTNAEIVENELEMHIRNSEQLSISDVTINKCIEVTK